MASKTVTVVNHSKGRIVLPDPSNPRGGVRLGSIEDRSAADPRDRNSQEIDADLWAKIKGHKAVKGYLNENPPVISVYGAGA